MLFKADSFLASCTAPLASTLRFHAKYYFAATEETLNP